MVEPVVPMAEFVQSGLNIPDVVLGERVSVQRVQGENEHTGYLGLLSKETGIFYGTDDLGIRTAGGNVVVLGININLKRSSTASSEVETCLHRTEC